MRHWHSVILASLLLACATTAYSEDWPRFGWDAAGGNAPPRLSGIPVDRLGSLRRIEVQLDGTADSSAIYLGGAMIGGRSRDAFFVTTSYGLTLAIDADSGALLWEYRPPSYGSLSGSYRITNASPVADPDRQYIYAAAPDGMIRKLAVADGSLVWSSPVTRLPQREKLASALNFARGRVIVATDGYIGDEPPYQGHVALLDAESGALLRVWNSLGSDRHELLDPASYPRSDSGIWGRAGVVVEPDSGDLYLATGNGLWDGIANWGDAVIRLDADAAIILGNYTPIETAMLDEEDRDLGSCSPALLGGDLIAQGGKDGWIRLLDMKELAGALPHRGGEIDKVPTPSGALLFSALAAARIEDRTWLFAADYDGCSAWTVENRRLSQRWHQGFGGTSPIIVAGLEYLYDPRGALRILEAASGRVLATLPCGAGHWNSPIVADGRIALPEGDANRHRLRGVLDIWSTR